MTRSARHHDLIAVRMLPPELRPPESGLMRLRDPETGEKMVVDWGSKKLREAYLERVADWRHKTDVALRRAEVDRIADVFEAQSYSMKRVFAETASYCMGN